MAQHSRFLRIYGSTDFITGLRAIAAAMVVLVHTGGLSDFGPIGQSITHAGKYGVDIFFVISGYTIAKTFSEAKNYRTYLVRRFMRIFPLYVFVISIATFLWISGTFTLPYWMVEFDAKPNFYNWLLHVSMLSYLDYKVANSLLGVEWSIPIEFFWYCCLPPVIYFGGTIYRTVGAVFVLLFLTALLSYVSKKMVGTSLPVKWSPIAYGHLFFMGVLSFNLREKAQHMPSLLLVVWSIVAVVAFVVVLFVDIVGRSAILAVATVIMIVCFSPQNTRWATGLLASKPMLFLGSISYSVYLVHALALHVMDDMNLLPDAGLGKFLIVYIATILISLMTYIWIEKPTNRFGRDLSEKM